MARYLSPAILRVTALRPTMSLTHSSPNVMTNLVNTSSLAERNDYPITSLTHHEAHATNPANSNTHITPTTLSRIPAELNRSTYLPLTGTRYSPHRPHTSSQESRRNLTTILLKTYRDLPTTKGLHKPCRNYTTQNDHHIP